MGLFEPIKPKIKGFMDEDECALLYELAKEAAKIGPCLEIGSYCGLSTAYLGMGCRDSNGILITIDHHRGSEEQQPGEEYFDPELLDQRTNKIDTLPLFRTTIHDLGLEDTVIAIVSKSETVARFWQTKLGLLFIDGGHSLKSVFSDYSNWFPHLQHGGYFVLHDLYPDSSKGGQAPRLIYELALASGLFEKVRFVNTTGVLRRVISGSLPPSVEELWEKIR